MVREKLPERRRNVTWKAKAGGCKLHFTVGYYEDGRPGEVFVDAGKLGSAVSMWAHSSAMLLSLLLQHGVSIEEVSALFKGFSIGIGIELHPTIHGAANIIDFVLKAIMEHSNGSADRLGTEQLTT